MLPRFDSVGLLLWMVIGLPVNLDPIWICLLGTYSGCVEHWWHFEVVDGTNIVDYILLGIGYKVVLRDY